MGSLDMCPVGQTYDKHGITRLCPSPAISTGDPGITFEGCDKASQLSTSSQGTGDSRESVKLQCRLGLRNGIGIIVGIIVGSGIFVSPRGVLQQCGSIGLSLIVWATCGLTALFGGLCYAELGTSIPTSGGPYSYILVAFGPLPAFLILWVTVLIRIPAGNAIMALTFANYALYPFFPDCEPPNDAKRILATLAVCLLSFLNCVSVKWATRVQDAFTTMKILAMVIIIVAGVVQLCRGRTENLHGFFEGTTDNPGKISLAIYAGMWSFSGWDGFNYVTEEIKNPRRNLPLAIWISIPLTTGMYVLANLAMFTVLPKEEILNSNAVAVTFGEEVLSVMSWLMPFFVAFSCFGSLNGALLTGSRTFFVGARDGHLPALMAMVNVKWLTPITSVIFAGVMTLAMLAAGEVYSLITYFEFIEAVMLAAPVVGLLYLRWKKPELERPVKVNLIIPVLFLLVSAFVIIFPWMVSPMETLWGVIMLATGVPVFMVGVVWTSKPKAFKRCVARLTRCIQKMFYCTFEEEDIKEVESKLL